MNLGKAKERKGKEMEGGLSKASMVLADSIPHKTVQCTPLHVATLAFNPIAET